MKHLNFGSSSIRGRSFAPFVDFDRLKIDEFCLHTALSSPFRRKYTSLRTHSLWQGMEALKIQVAGFIDRDPGKLPRDDSKMHWKIGRSVFFRVRVGNIVTPHGVPDYPIECVLFDAIHFAEVLRKRFLRPTESIPL